MGEFLVWMDSVLGVKQGTVTIDSKAEDIEKWDSLMHLRIIMETEEKYGVEIPMDQINEIKSVRDLWSYINNA
ncbi:acyl carrier protein [Otoolea muris]|uniref:acyl carrier protein n=1 Tax=Otoolea muris TaxID=2941515 RepID=UPI002042243B|nr:acyl carrier protein [Otoolea muris]